MDDGLEVEVVPDVVVLDVDVDHARAIVLADLYGGPTNACGTVRFRLDDPAARDQASRVLHRWRRRETPLTLVARGTSVTLQDAQALFSGLVPPDPML